MAELCRNGQHVSEELQKTDAVSAKHCSSQIERLEVPPSHLVLTCQCFYVFRRPTSVSW